MRVGLPARTQGAPLAQLAILSILQVLTEIPTVRVAVSVCQHTLLVWPRNDFQFQLIVCCILFVSF